MDTNAAAALSLSASGRLRRVDDSHVLCTSTLGVLHNAASRAARMGLLACRSARHAVVELKIAVKLNTDLKFIDRERGNIGRGTASKAGAARDIRMGFAGDACVLECSFTQAITLGAAAESAGTGETTEIKAAILRERSKIETAPVKTRGLLSIALVVCVGRARKGRGISPSSRCHLKA